MAFYRCSVDNSGSSVPSSFAMSIDTLANSRPAGCYTSMNIKNIGWTKIRKNGGNIYPANVSTLYCYDPADEEGTKFILNYNNVDFDVSTFDRIAIKVVNSNASVAEMNIQITVYLS